MAVDVNAPSYKLFRRLVENGVDANEATELMNGYAHELAEKIRSEMEYDSYAYASGWEAAADLIDPQMPTPGA